MKTVLGSFKGNPTITLNPGAKYPFSFGADKARMIVECIDEIKAFAAANPPKQKPAASRLVVTLDNGLYHAEEMQEPRRSELQMMFGTSKLPTPFKSPMLSYQVIGELRKLNPGADIIFHKAEVEPAAAQ